MLLMYPQVGIHFAGSCCVFCIRRSGSSVAASIRQLRTRSAGSRFSTLGEIDRPMQILGHGFTVTFLNRYVLRYFLCKAIGFEFTVFDA